MSNTYKMAIFLVPDTPIEKRRQVRYTMLMFNSALANHCENIRSYPGFDACRVDAVLLNWEKLFNIDDPISYYNVLVDPECFEKQLSRCLAKYDSDVRNLREDLRKYREKIIESTGKTSDL